MFPTRSSMDLGQDRTFSNRGQALALILARRLTNPARALLERHGSAATRPRSGSPLPRRRPRRITGRRYSSVTGTTTPLSTGSAVSARYTVSLLAYCSDAEPRAPRALPRPRRPSIGSCKAFSNPNAALQRPIRPGGPRVPEPVQGVPVRDGRVPPHPCSLRPPESRARRRLRPRGGLPVQRSPSVLRWSHDGLVDPTFVLNLVGGTSGYAADRQRSGRKRSRSGEPKRPRRPAPVARRGRSSSLALSSSWTSTSSGDSAGDARRVVPGIGRVRPGPPAALRVTDVAAALGRTDVTTSIAVREISERLPGMRLRRQVDRVVES